MRRLTALSLALAVVALTGCPSREVSKITPSQEKTEYKDIPVQLNREVDLLFMVDDSGSMEEEQTALAANFPDFINVLNTIEGGLPNVHIGVISPNVGAGGYNISGCTGGGDGGRLQANGAGCTALPGPEPYIIDVLNEATQTRTKNYSGELKDVFSCIAKLGSQGCGFEQPLEAVYQALNANPSNGAFLRADAYLAVVLITDEDDCSAEDPSVFNDSEDAGTLNLLGPLDSFRCAEFGVTCAEGNLTRQPASYTGCHARTDSYLRDPKYYADFLKSLKADENMIVVAGIFGNPEPVQVQLNTSMEPELTYSCGVAANQPAAPGVRVNEFLSYFSNNTYTSICDGNMADALVLIAELLKRVIGNACIEGDISTDDLFADNPGLQVDCQVSDVFKPNTDEEEQAPLPRCQMQADGLTPVDGQEACWYVYENAEDCDRYPSRLALEVFPEERNAPPGTHVVARCRLK